MVALPHRQTEALLVGHCTAGDVSRHLSVAKMLVAPIVAVQNQEAVGRTEALHFAASNEHALQQVLRV